jgi:hypothetical protein
MSAEIQKGKAVIWSIGTLVFTGGIASVTAKFLPQKFDFNRSSQKTEIKGLDGGTQAVVFSDFKKSISITVVPSSTTLTLAKASGDLWLPKPGTSVTITDTESTLTGATYNVNSSKQGRTVDGVVTADLELETSDDGYDITTLIA